MIEEMKKFREQIRTNIAELKAIKDKNYHELYNNGDLRYVEEISRSLYVSAANVATFIEHISTSLDMTKTETHN